MAERTTSESSAPLPVNSVVTPEYVFAAFRATTVLYVPARRFIVRLPVPDNGWRKSTRSLSPCVTVNGELNTRGAFTMVSPVPVEENPFVNVDVPPSNVNVFSRRAD